MKSLIVDDDAVSRNIFRTILSQYGECISVSNGTSAMNEYKIAMDRGIPYNLAVIDIMMPDISGYQVLKYIRSLETAKNIYPPNCTKVIIATGLDDEENRQIEHELNEECETYLAKTADIYQETINKLRELGFYEV